MLRTTLLLTLALLPCATAVARPVVVVQDEAAINHNAYDLRARALLAARDLGARVIRLNMVQWNQTDAEAPFAVARFGLRPQLTIAGDLSYVRATVLRYRTIVSTYAVWNEPDLGSWRCCSAPFVETAGFGSRTRYRQHYIRAYRLIKRLDPGAKVLIGELSPNGMGKVRHHSWFGKMLRQGALRADGLAMHPYEWHWSGVVDRRYLRALQYWRVRMRRWGKYGLLTRPNGDIVPTYNTEYGIRRFGYQGEPRWAVRAWSYAKQLHYRQFAQYMIFPSGQAWNTSLTDAACRPTKTYLALRQAIRGIPRTVPVPWSACPDAEPFITPPPPSAAPYERYK